MARGDVLVHDVMVVHGSEAVTGNRLRRTIYYEFRAAERIVAEGPWDRDKPAPLANRELESKIAHTVHTSGSHCSAGSVVRAPASGTGREPGTVPDSSGESPGIGGIPNPV